MDTGRVVMIRYEEDGVLRVGSGLQVGGHHVLTAAHVAQGTGHSVLIGPREFPAMILLRSPDPAVDLAVLDVPDAEDLEWLGFARVDRETVATIQGCVAVGFPAFTKDENGHRRREQVAGFIPTASGYTAVPGKGMKPGFLSLKATGPGIRDSLPGGDLEQSPWAGMSGAVVVSADNRILGVVRHHNRPEGAGTLALTPVGAIDLLPEPDQAAFWEALRVTDPDRLPLLPRGQPVEPLVGLAEPLAGNNELPLIENLDPYQLGATPSRYGRKNSFGQHDQYVPRTHENVDARVEAALEPGRMVLIVGPSKAGKTRTAFHAMLARWPQAALLGPTPPALASLARHPRLANSSDPLIVWLDDLQRYLTGVPEPLTPALLTSLLARNGPTMVIATLRTEERTRLVRDTGELTRDARRVLEEATQVKLGPTSDHLEEQVAARAFYPDEDLSVFGLAEQLAGAPALLEQYLDARHTAPVVHAIILTAVDWVRVGIPWPVPEMDLSALALQTLEAKFGIIISPKKIRKKIAEVATPPVGAGRVAALATMLLPDRSSGYLPFSYLVASDDGQGGEPRPIPEEFWSRALERVDPYDAFSIGFAAYERNDSNVAIYAFKLAADSGNIAAMVNLGVLLTNLEPPDPVGARTWYEKAADAGDTAAMNNIGVLLANLEPPDPVGARTWYEKAADAGNTAAMNNIGVLLANLEPPDPVGARAWWEKAADAGNTDAMNNIGLLLANLEPPDPVGARAWYEKAADAGNTAAMNNIGGLLANLEPPDPVGARAWYEKAANAGNTDAMNNLGLLLANLEPPDPVGARAWYEKAANAGNTAAMNNLGILLAGLEPPDPVGARAWYEKAANAGITAAMNNLGLLLEGLEPPDPVGARAWYEKAANAGITAAMNNLGLLLEGLEPPDPVGARAWYEKAANAGDTAAMNNLGILLEGLEPPDPVGARAWYEKAANAGNTAAMNNLGILLTGLEPPDPVGARAWYEKAGDVGNTDAMNNLGVLLEGLEPPDPVGARAWYEKAGDAGNTAAMVNLGVLLAGLEPPDPVGARAWYEKAGDAGNTDAMVNLGVLLAGMDPPDPVGARAWWEKAGDAGDTDAMVNLGVLLAGMDPPDPVGARAWWEKAGDAGNTDAMVRLGVLLAGMDPPDPVGALAWWEKAGDAGNTDAMVNLGVLLADLDPPDRAGARAWWEKAANAGNTDAMVRLGVLLQGMDPPDPVGALAWWEKAANAGNTVAMYNIGVLLADLDPPDRAGARAWYEKAANAGNTDAMNNLGFLLEEMDPPDRAGARAWWEKAANAGNTEAMNNLGFLLANLEPPDPVGARAWYEKAANAGNTEAMNNIGILLTNLEPPDRAGARAWYEKAANAGAADAMNNIGILLTNLEPPDRSGARTWFERAAKAGSTDALYSLGYLMADHPGRLDIDKLRARWQKVIDAGPDDVSDETVLLTLLGLAAVEALIGESARAGELLDLAKQHGALSAEAYKDVLSPKLLVRESAVLVLSNLPEDSDALNFLGVANYLAGEEVKANHYWLRSVQLDDVIAPLLLRIAEIPPS
ncbi:bifunctional trypsin-like peptidase domain-containing/SEL1-like repeat protein [Arthrobacter sp. BE255]|uniref:bifunctional trypsin-like peptidase domain-containing/SEL1-like repeat protein n=1 Tax=Arthrobacter sp. BE255 TaxID=2817721 RepID=UPI00286C4AB8|nr:bifunctional trypsin-like peptidase domain-containing/SEL1-like repeat protein [Arthrobacter sp. BE255]